MVKQIQDGPAIRSAYPLVDQPIGTSVPFMPSARPWNVRSTRALDDHDDSATAVSEAIHPAAQKPMQVQIGRKTASVTENQGFVEPPKVLNQDANLRSAGRPLNAAGGLLKPRSYVREDILTDLMEERSGAPPPRDEDVLTKPAIVFLIIGIFLPPFLFCGVRYLKSMNMVARRVGYCSIFILLCYLLAGLIVFVQMYTAMYKTGWSGTDPICIRYLQGQGQNALGYSLGSAMGVMGMTAVGLGPTPNISLYQVNCGIVLQVPVLQPTAQYQTMYTRVLTPRTTGDDFGVYVRNRPEGQLNRFSDQPPALAWFQYADPYVSNPPKGPASAGPPPCPIDMCSGKYAKASPLIAGIQYNVEVLLPRSALPPAPLPHPLACCACRQGGRLGSSPIEALCAPGF